MSDFSRTPATQDDVQKTGVQPVAGSAIRRALETSPFPILLVCLVGVVLLSVFAPAIVVGDTWLTLMAGREVVENGLPHTEHLTDNTLILPLFHQMTDAEHQRVCDALGSAWRP